MLKILITIPQGEPGSIEIRPLSNNPLAIGPLLEHDSTITEVDAEEFMTTAPDDLAVRYASPAFALLQNKLLKRGF